MICLEDRLLIDKNCYDKIDDFYIAKSSLNDTKRKYNVTCWKLMIVDYIKRLSLEELQYFLQVLNLEDLEVHAEVQKLVLAYKLDENTTESKVNENTAHIDSCVYSDSGITPGMTYTITFNHKVNSVSNLLQKVKDFIGKHTNI